jgi:hypothetical protein
MGLRNNKTIKAQQNAAEPAIIIIIIIIIIIMELLEMSFVYS